MSAVVERFIETHLSAKSVNSKEKVQNMLAELASDLLDSEGKVSIEQISRLDEYYVGKRIQKIFNIIESDLVVRK